MSSLSFLECEAFLVQCSLSVCAANPPIRLQPSQWSHGLSWHPGALLCQPNTVSPHRGADRFFYPRVYSSNAHLTWSRPKPVARTPCRPLTGGRTITCCQHPHCPGTSAEAEWAVEVALCPVFLILDSSARSGNLARCATQCLLHHLGYGSS